MRNVTRAPTPPFPEWPRHHSLKCILPFFLFPSHEGPIIWRGWLRCAGESFSWGTDQLYTGVDSYFKDGWGGGRKEERILFKHIAWYISSIIPSLLSLTLCLSFFLSVLPLASQKLLSKNRSHYMPLYTLSLFLTCTHTLIEQRTEKECGGCCG